MVVRQTIESSCSPVSKWFLAVSKTHYLVPYQYMALSRSQPVKQEAKTGRIMHGLCME